MSIVSQEIGLTIAQESIGKKSDEIPKLPKMIEKLDLENKVVTMDALNTQKPLAQAILDKGGDY